MSVRLHAAAFLALLDADDANPALVVFDGHVPRASSGQPQRPPYVLVYLSVGAPGAALEPGKSDATFRSQLFRTSAICHSVGVDASAARSVADRVRAAVLDVTPAVAGRSCWPIRWVDGQSARRDETTGMAVIDVIDVYEFDSVPA